MILGARQLPSHFSYRRTATRKRTLATQPLYYHKFVRSISTPGLPMHFCLSQQHIADRAEILIRALATVGIVALIDEATGYQRIRTERALATILEKFIAEELRPWTRTFPYEFYEQIFRLRGWDSSTLAQRPSVIGHYTNDFVYARIAPGVLEELRRLNPTLPQGGRKNRHHQWFTPDFGHPKLKEHLAAVIALMRAAPNWSAFQQNLGRALPRINTTIPMALDDVYDS